MNELETPETPPTEDIQDRWPAIAELRGEGLVHHIGVSNFDVEELRRIPVAAGLELTDEDIDEIETRG